MKQIPLLKRDKPALPKLRADADARNLESARIIVADRARYLGLQLEWAERILAKAEAAKINSKNVAMTLDLLSPVGDN